jgi:MFS family permease
MYSVTFLLSLYLQYILGFSSSVSGLIMAIQTILMLIFAPISGRLSDRYDPGKIASFGMCIVTVAMLMLALLDANSSLIYIVITLVILGIGIGIFSAPNTTAIMSSVKRKYYSVASASVSTMRLIGQTSGMALCLLTFSIFIGSNQILPNQYPALLTSIRVVFLISFVLSIFAIFASLARTERNEN